MKPQKQLRKFSGSDSEVVQNKAAGNDFDSLEIAARSAGFFDSTRFADLMDPEASTLSVSRQPNSNRGTGRLASYTNLPPSKPLSTEREHNSGAEFRGLRRASRGFLAKHPGQSRYLFMC